MSNNTSYLVVNIHWTLDQHLTNADTITECVRTVYCDRDRGEQVVLVSLYYSGVLRQYNVVEVSYQNLPTQSCILYDRSHSLQSSVLERHHSWCMSSTIVCEIT